jgi:WD40 repeat protein
MTIKGITLLLALFLLNTASVFSQAYKVTAVKTFDAPIDIFNQPIINFSPDSKWLVFGAGKDNLVFYSVSDGNSKSIVPGNKSFVTAVGFHPSGSPIAVGFKDGSIQMYDSKTQAITKTIMAHEKAINHISFSSDGQTFYSGSKDNTIKSWSAAVML